MRRISGFLFLLLTLFSCKKEPADFDWERSFGKGKAFFAIASSDSGIIAGGQIENKPCLLKLSKGKEKIIDFVSANNGLFSSAWYDTSCFVVAGSSDGKMLIEVLDNDGTGLWDTTFSAGFLIDITSLWYTGSGSFLAMGSASPDSVNAGATGLLFVRFDTSGYITSKNELVDDNFLAAGSLAMDNIGNIFLPLTRKRPFIKSSTSIAKFNGDFQKIWETSLYNNKDYGAACFDIVLDDQGSLYVSGKTEVSKQEGVQTNSFVASLTVSGAVRWKNYLESTNCGTALLLEDDNLMTLNTNCFIISKVKASDGSDTGLQRVFNVCISEDTDAFGNDLDMNYDGSYLLSGSLGGNFYLALKSSLE